MTESALTVTLKAAGGYDAPWVVVRADDPVTIVQYLNALAELNVLGTVANVAREFGAIYTVGDVLGGKAKEIVPTAPWDTLPAAPAYAPPAGGQFQTYVPPAAVDHGPAPLDQYGKPRKFVESKPGAAKAWKAWMGDYPKGDPQGSTVEPQWIR